MGGGDGDLTKGKEASLSERAEIRRRRSELIARLVATKPTAAEVAQPAGAEKKKKKKKLVKTILPPELVAEIMRRPVTPFPVIPDEMLPEFSERFRAVYANQNALADELMALDADIIEQQKAKGYAELEEEVTDNEDEN